MTNSNSLDRRLEDLSIFGVIFRRNYAYFKNHIAITNLIHFSFGLGVGILLFASDNIWGWILLLLGIFGHVYAFLRADK